MSTVPQWATLGEWLGLVARGVTFRTASRVSLIVGTILSAVNQGAVIASGDAGPATAVRVVFNYLVPFTVASVGYLAPFRAPRGAPAGPAKD
ncbi:MAG: nitrate/nitrite transporter NrtS [Acidimicrobiia bacterium]|nr:nitrate/nitrite transporter NrtS [Acidimicrobiia bacterium]